MCILLNKRPNTINEWKNKQEQYKQWKAKNQTIQQKKD